MQPFDCAGLVKVNANLGFEDLAAIGSIVLKLLAKQTRTSVFRQTPPLIIIRGILAAR